MNTPYDLIKTNCLINQFLNNESGTTHFQPFLWIFLLPMLNLESSILNSKSDFGVISEQSLKNWTSGEIEK